MPCILLFLIDIPNLPDPVAVLKLERFLLGLQKNVIGKY